MKKRIISGIVATILVAPAIIIGGNLFKFMAIVLALLALKEFIDIRETKKKFPILIKIIAYIIITLLIVSNSDQQFFVFGLEYWIMSVTLLGLLLPVALYYCTNKYNIKDAMHLIGSVLFLGTVFNLIFYVRDLGLSYLILVLLITTVTDIFAYSTGMLIGRNRFKDSPSPNKSLEGYFGGAIMGTFVGTMFYITVINVDVKLYVIIPIVLTLSIIGQLGDLVFSSVKRYYGKKDFSNIMPGHGGVLDRIDSLIFVLLAFVLFLNIL